MQKKHSRTEWIIAGAIIAAGFVWYAYESYKIETPEYQQQLQTKLKAELEKESSAQRLEEQRDDIAKQIHEAMLASMKRCTDARDADAPKLGSQVALARYAECAQAHKRQFGIQ